MKPLIDNKIENILPTAGIFAGYALISIGLISLFNNLLIGVVVLILGLIMIFTYNGVQIDVPNKRIRNYTKCLGLLIGKWQGLDVFTDIAVLQTNETSRALSLANVALKESEKYYDVFLLNKSHRIKFRIKRCLEKSMAIEDAQSIAGLLELEYSIYSPVISEATHLKR